MPGYTFGGWYDGPKGGEGGAYVETSAIFQSSMKLYAYWIKNGSEENPDVPKTFTVTFDSQGGSLVSPQNVASGSRAARPANPIRSGYTFGGWFKESACSNGWSFETDTVTRNITLYARWTKSGGTTDPGGDRKSVV